MKQGIRWDHTTCTTMVHRYCPGAHGTITGRHYAENVSFQVLSTLRNGRNRSCFNARSAARCGFGDDFQGAASYSRCLVRLVCITHGAGQLAAVSLRRACNVGGPDMSTARRHEHRSSSRGRLDLRWHNVRQLERVARSSRHGSCDDHWSQCSLQVEHVQAALAPSAYMARGRSCSPVARCTFSERRAYAYNVKLHGGTHG